MTNYKKALAALKELQCDAQGDELAELHFATGHLLKAKSWAAGRLR